MPDVKFDSIVGFLPVNIHLEQPEKDEIPSCFNIAAITPCEIITITTTKLQALRQAGPIFDQCINQTTSNTIDRRRNIDEMFLHGTKAERIERFHTYYKPWDPYICNDLIANYLKMSRTQYYSIRNNLLINSPEPNYF